MAGYFLSSILQKPFEEFVAKPSDAQLKKFIEFLGEEYDQTDQDMDEEDECHQWVGPKAKVMEVVRKRLAKPKWYFDLSPEAAEIFSRAMNSLISEKKLFGYRAEAGDFHYLSVLTDCSAAEAKLKKKGAKNLAVIGSRPYRYEPGKSKDGSLDDWEPYHGLFDQSEVTEMLEAAVAAEKAIRKCVPYKQAEYDQLVLPLLEKLSQEPRMLYVELDT